MWSESANNPHDESQATQQNGTLFSNPNFEFHLK